METLTFTSIWTCILALASGLSPVIGVTAGVVGIMTGWRLYQIKTLEYKKLKEDG